MSANQPETRLLRYFLVLADELHFGRAAARLGLAQPPLSQQIRKLEAELGFELFARSSRRVELTPAGKEFQLRAMQLLEYLDSAVTDVRRIARGETELRVGYVALAMATFLPEAIRAFRHKFPSIKLWLSEASSSELLEMSRDRRLDVAILTDPPALSGYIERVVLREPLVLVSSQRDARVHGRKLDWSSLPGDGLISFPRSQAPALRDQIEHICIRNGLSPTVMQEAQSWLSMLSMVAVGGGFTIAPTSVRAFRVAGLAYRRIPRTETTIKLVLREDAVTVTSRAFIGVIQDLH